MLRCTFDPGSRLLLSSGPESHTDTVCPHLSPALQHLLQQGATVQEINRMAWSLIDLDIVLDRAPDPRELPAAVREEAGAATWINLDSHYPLNHGLVCATCRQALAWPHDRDPEAAVDL